MLLPPPSALWTRIELEWDTGDGIFVRQAGRGSYRCICVQLTANTTFTVLGESQTLQRLCLVPTTKTSRTHGTEVILFISHQGRVQLGYADTFPMDGIVLLQYKLPHVHCQGVPVELLLPSQLQQSKNNLPQKHSQNIPFPKQKFPPPHRLPRHTQRSQTEPGMLFPDRNFLLLCHWPQTWQGIIQVLTSPCFILQPDQDKTHHFFVC